MKKQIEIMAKVMKFNWENLLKDKHNLETMQEILADVAHSIYLMLIVKFQDMEFNEAVNKYKQSALDRQLYG